MAFFEHDGATIHYQVAGHGFPVLLIAPGGMHSAFNKWALMPWNPLAALTDDFQVIAMDQRNAGQSTAPISATDGWDTYTADQLALVDHLGIDRFAVAGMCIGGPYITGLCMAAPERVAASVILQPIGLDNNHQAFYDMFDGWRAEVAPAHPEADDAAFDAFRSNMYDGEFMFNTTREQAAAIETPTMVLMGNDLYHPESTSRELAELLPTCTFIEDWKDGEALDAASAAIATFLAGAS
ncbi:alpha/beta hydrolase [bacterium]|nr:alpha/beta hydrolase [bacterium]HAY70127.1 alpha/beta hydrolase [Acidimicrobiaceae bacterium]